MSWTAQVVGVAKLPLPCISLEEAHWVQAWRRCDERCEAVILRKPPGYPFVGYYCNLHKSQAPVKDKESGLTAAPEKYRAFLLKRVDSFRSEEDLLLAELIKARSRPGSTLEMQGAALLDWLTSDRKLTFGQARASAERMLEAGLLEPTAASLSTSTIQKSAVYIVHDPESLRAHKS